MTLALRKKTVVQNDGVLKVTAPELKAGTTAEVIVLVEEEQGKSSLRSRIGSARGLYPTPESADNFIRSERDAWES